jgi:hypothetical protein
MKRLIWELRMLLVIIFINLAVRIIPKTAPKTLIWLSQIPKDIYAN